MSEIEKRKIWLETRKRDLIARMARIEDALDGPFTSDVEDGAIEHQEDEVLDLLGVSGQHEVLMIDAALARIAQGSYGDCAKCGTKISDKRLDALPFTPLCVGCAGELP